MEFGGHTDQVNQVIEYKHNQFVSCSSDGTVNLYDISVGSEPVKRLNVLKNTSVVRPGHCRAVLAVAAHDQFVVTLFLNLVSVYFILDLRWRCRSSQI